MATKLRLFDGSRRKVAQDVIDHFGVLGEIRRTIADRARQSEVYAEACRTLAAATPVSSAELVCLASAQTIIRRSVGWWWKGGAGDPQLGQTFLDKEFSEIVNLAVAFGIAKGPRALHDFLVGLGSCDNNEWLEAIRKAR